MDSEEAAARLARTDRSTRLSARSGAWLTAAVVSAAVLAVGVVVDLELVWLSGLVALGVAGLWAARPLRPRLDWSDRIGSGLVVGGAVLAVIAYIGVQLAVRAAGWPAPHTCSALAAAVVVLLVCRAGLQRLASPAAGARGRTR